MKRITVLTTLTALLALWTVTTWAGAPDSVNFQGRLRDGSGNPITVASNVTYRIYDGSGGGAALLWGPETHNVTPDAGGLYNVTLGSLVSFPSNLFAGTPRYLGITIAADPEVTPRTQIVSVAYALRVKTVDGATGGTIRGDVSVEGNAHISGNLTKDYTVGTPDLATPIAYAFINSDGTMASGTSNVSSVWNAGNSRYEITITGESYSASSYVTVVTPRVSGAPEALFATTNSSGGILLIRVMSSSTGTSGLQKDFQFVTFKP